MKRIVTAYAAWTRRQASAVNCGHYAVLGAVAAALVLMLVAGSAQAALIALAALVAVLCAAALGYAAWRVSTASAQRRARVTCCTPCAQAGRRTAATGMAEFEGCAGPEAFGVCASCYAAMAAPVPAPDPWPGPLATDHVLPWKSDPDRWDPATAQLPAAAPDNAAAVDPVTAADLAAVLERAQVRP